MIFVFAAALVITCVIFHGFMLQLIARWLFRTESFSFYRISILILAAIVAHLIEIVFFQIVYVWLVLSDNHGSIAGAEHLFKCGRPELFEDKK